MLLKRMTSTGLLVCLLVLASAGYSSGLVGTDCKACHEQATCKPVSGQSVECTCHKGFSGDGFSCTPSPAGSPGGGHAPVRRRRFSDSSSSDDDVNNVRATCGFYECGSGEDCFTSSGYQECADPCKTYTELDNSWRSTQYKTRDSDRHCDRYVKWDGWYRLYVDTVSTAMPETCVDPFMCGTQAPMWLASPHPTIRDGVAQRKVCASYRGNCCWVQTTPIHVKACPGDFYVYKFVIPPGCYFAYCAAVAAPTTPGPTTIPRTTTTTTPDTTTTVTPAATTTTTTPDTTPPETAVLYFTTTTTTTPVDYTTPPETPPPFYFTTTRASAVTATTAENGNKTTPKAMCPHCEAGESCISDDGATWRCERPEKPTLPAPELECGQAIILVGLRTSSLAAVGLDAASANLADPRCHTHQERDGIVWYQVDRIEGNCGNILQTNGTHAIYSNSLFVYPIQNVYFTRPVSVPFSCVYPLGTNASLDAAIRPFLSLKDEVTGKGSKVRASMLLYHNANYTEPYPAGQGVKLAVGSVLHVGVTVEESETERFVAVLEECYATHSSDPGDLMRYYLIQLRCPSEQRQVTVVENGSSLKAHFSALLFLFQGNYQDIFLHCNLSLCDQRSSSCSPVCSKRKRRSAHESVPLKPLTIGPITYIEKLN